MTKFKMQYKHPRMNIIHNCPNFKISRFLTPIKTGILANGAYFFIVGTHTSVKQKDKVTFLLLDLNRTCVFSQSIQLNLIGDIDSYQNYVVNNVFNLITPKPKKLFGLF